MINQKIDFASAETPEELEDLLRVFFGEKKFLLELACETELPDLSSFEEIFLEAKGSLSKDDGESYAFMHLLRRCFPNRITHFTGLKKFDNTWWACIMEIVDPTNRFGVGASREMETATALLVGWDTNNGSGGRVAGGSSSEDIDGVEDLMSRYQERVSEKVGRNYTAIHTIELDTEEENAVDLNPPDDLPEIAGLGLPTPRKEHSFEEFFHPPIKEILAPPSPKPVAPVATGPYAPTPEPPEEAKKEEPKKTKKKKSKKQIAKEAKAEVEKADLKAVMQARKKESDW